MARILCYLGLSREVPECDGAWLSIFKLEPHTQQSFLRTLVIEREEWVCLSNPAYLARYWEPTQEPGDFHCTFALALCWTPFHDCEDKGRTKEFVVLVAVVRKMACFGGILFSVAAVEFCEFPESTMTLLIVRLHRSSWLFPDIYYDRYHSHFTHMHDSGAHYNVGHPQKYIRALLHNAYRAGDQPSPRAKLRPGYLDNPMAFPIDSCVQGYRDWTTDCPDKSPWMNILFGSPMSSCHSVLIRGPHISHWSSH